LLVSTGHNATVIGGDGATVTTTLLSSWSPLCRAASRNPGHHRYPGSFCRRSGM